MKTQKLISTHNSTNTAKALLSTHNMCFCGEIRKMLCGYPSYLEQWTFWFRENQTWNFMRTVCQAADSQVMSILFSLKIHKIDFTLAHATLLLGVLKVNYCVSTFWPNKTNQFLSLLSLPWHRLLALSNWSREEIVDFLALYQWTAYTLSSL